MMMESSPPFSPLLPRRPADGGRAGEKEEVLPCLESKLLPWWWLSRLPWEWVSSFEWPEERRSRSRCDSCLCEPCECFLGESRLVCAARRSSSACVIRDLSVVVVVGGGGGGGGVRS